MSLLKNPFPIFFISTKSQMGQGDLSSERVQHPVHWKHAGSVPKRPTSPETLARAAAERLERRRQRLAAIKTVPTDDQWAPQIIAFIQDRWECGWVHVACCGAWVDQSSSWGGVNSYSL